MNRLSALLMVALVAISASCFPAQAADTTKKEAPKYWTKGIMTQVGFSQVSLTNWAEGGNASISLNGVVDANANYAKDKMIWENRLKISYGFIQKFEDCIDPRQNFSKSDDRVILDSKWGWMLVDKLYFSALLNFRTQLTQTFSWSVDPENQTLIGTPQSSFMAPGYLSLGVGIDYKPWNFLSVNLSPLTGNMVVVTLPELRETYGVDPNHPVKMQFGAQLKVDAKYSYRTFRVGTTLNLFMDYLALDKGVQVYWDVDASWAVAKFLTLNLNTSLIWDKNIMIEKAGVKAPRVQFKEVLSVGLTFTFGQYIKPN